MTFREATDRLSAAGVTLAAVSEALGVAPQTARVFRAREGARNFRRPPEHWPQALAQLAMERARELDRIAARLNEQAQP